MMSTIATASRFGFLFLGIPLSLIGALALWNGLTAEGLESWGATLGAAALIVVGCLCMMTAFLADLVIRHID